MAEVIYANDIKTVISNVGGINAAALSMTVSDASAFPAIAAGDYLYLTLIRASDLAIERVKATAISGDTVTITRAQEGTTALVFAQNDRVLGAVTKGLLDDIKAELAASIAANAVVAAEASNAAAAAAATAADALAQVSVILPVDTADLSDGAVTGPKIADEAVGAAHIAAAAVGSGLAGGAGTALSVNVDNVTLNVSGGLVAVKTGGISKSHVNGGFFAALTGAGTSVWAGTYNPTNPYTAAAEATPFYNSTKGVAADAPVFVNSGGWLRVYLVLKNAVAHAALIRVRMGGNLEYFLGTGTDQGVILYDYVTIPASTSQYVAIALDVQPGGAWMLEHANYNGAGSCGWPQIHNLTFLEMR